MSGFAVPSSELTIGLPDNDQAILFLSNKGWPAGLRETLVNNLRNFPIRFYIVDDSGSMMANDGSITVSEGGGHPRTIDCTRWQELVQSMDFVANFANASKAATEFRLLNNCPRPILVGFQGDNTSYGLLQAKEAFKSSPGGGTPLCAHVNEIVSKIRSLEPQLRANGQKAVFVIATDGEASDGDVAAALRPIKDLPVQLIVRLCTNEERIVKYWNDIDQDLELNMDVLDDVRGEAEEIAKRNNWMTYAEPLHLLRLFGVTVKEFDILDERKLSGDEMRNMVTLILTGGDPATAFPHPEASPAEFMAKLNTVNSHKVWCTQSRKMDHWIKTRQLKAAYGAHGGSCLIG